MRGFGDGARPGILAAAALVTALAVGAMPSAAAAPPSTRHGVGAAVPAGFEANSVTWTSPQQGWILGDAACGANTCTSVIGTTDGGKTWSLLGSLEAPIAKLGNSANPGVTEIRMANPLVGWVSGSSLYITTDGGRSWAPETIPGGGHQVLALAVNGSSAYAVVSSCQWATGECPVNAWRHAATAGGQWTPLPLDLAATQFIDLAAYNQAVYVVDGGTGDGARNQLYVSTDGGAHFAGRPNPCGHFSIAQVVPTSPTDVGLLCDGGAGMGVADKYVELSTDTGRTYQYAGTLAPPRNDNGIQAELGISASGNLLVAAMSDGSFIYAKDTQEPKWTLVIAKSDGGIGWNDLVYTTDQVAWVIYGPPDYFYSDLGELYVTRDAGQHWSAVRL